MVRIDLASGDRVPLKWNRGLYTMSAILNTDANKDLLCDSARALANTHGARSHSHAHKLAPNDGAVLLHRRLHLGLAKLKQLAHSTLDAPKSLALATAVDCEACELANMRSLAHP